MWAYWFWCGLVTAVAVVHAACVDYDPYTCGLHPRCLYADGRCRAPPQYCTDRLTWDDCVHGVSCVWEAGNGTCRDLRLPYTYRGVLEECTRTHPATTVPPSAVGRAFPLCMDGSHPHCAWDVYAGVCAPRYTTQCPGLPEDSCDDVGGCVWRPDEQACEGLAAGGVDCATWNHACPTSPAAVCYTDGSRCRPRLPRVHHSQAWGWTVHHELYCAVAPAEADLCARKWRCQWVPDLRACRPQLFGTGAVVWPAHHVAYPPAGVVGGWAWLTGGAFLATAALMACVAWLTPVHSRSAAPRSR